MELLLALLQLLNILDDNSKFDLFLGNYLSTPLRMRSYPPEPFFLSTEDSDEDDDGDYILSLNFAMS